jgi:hypothetical protein
MRLGFWRPLLFLFGGSPGRSYAEVTPEAVRFRFGFFDRVVPRSEIVEVEQRSWPWWLGVGWRSNLVGTVGLIGARTGVVQVRLRTRIWVWFVFACDRIAISVEDPEGFVAALASG